jgi:nicotinic acetylcholine receptor
LKWNPEDYGNISVIHIAFHEIWQPDITCYNSASAGSGQIDSFSNTHCLAYNNGEVLWVPSIKLETYCTLDFRNWPYDSQTCSVIFGSWVYDGFHINLQVAEAPIDVTIFF